jgi:membrane protease YdiL (CAAX protease family)
LWEQCTKWRIGIKWYLVAFALPLVLSAASLGIGLLASGGQFDYTAKVPLAYFLPFFLYMVVFTGVWEEPGWRGFALPRLQHRYSAYKSSWILGVLVGAWHFHFQVYYVYALGIAPLVVSLIILALGTVGWTIVLTWLYNNTRSVWLIIVLHGWGNTVQSYLILSSNNLPAQALYGILPWLIAVVLLWMYGKEHLAPHPRPQATSEHDDRLDTVGMVEQRI